MPSRKLNKNYYSSVSGISYSQKNNHQVGFESTLERDFIYLLEFDLNVKNYQEQPVTIEYKDDQSKLRRYTPDFLITYSDNNSLGKYFTPVLCEIKYRNDLWKKWEEYKPKFKAGLKYASDRQWRFKIITEKEIRTEYLYNAKFLLRYRNAEHDIGMIETLYDVLKELRITFPEEIIKVATISTNRRAELLHNLWYMISNEMIGYDLNTQLTMKSEIWAIDFEAPKFNPL